MTKNCDTYLVESVGRDAVRDICTELGCGETTQICCIPHSGCIELCAECYHEIREQHCRKQEKK